jgi:hypothetical protein
MPEITDKRIIFPLVEGLDTYIRTRKVILRSRNTDHYTQTVSNLVVI